MHKMFNHYVDGLQPNKHVPPLSAKNSILRLQWGRDHGLTDLEPGFWLSEVELYICIILNHVMMMLLFIS